MPTKFTIEREEDDTRTGLAAGDEDVSFLGEAGNAEQGAQVITLEKALQLAVTRSRIYQNQKELLYLRALALTLDRHQFGPIFEGRVAGDYIRSTSDVSKLSAGAEVGQALPGWINQAGNIADTRLANAGAIGSFMTYLPAGSVPPGLPAALQGIGALAGTPGDILAAYSDVAESALTITGANQPHTEIMNERSLSGQTSLGASILLKGGAQIAANLTSNFLRYLTGDPRVTTSSALTASITQPLLRGRGRKVAAETLTQSERDVLYELRAFTRFRKVFTVQVASEYYRVLQDRDTARNTWAGYQAFQQALERERARAEAGRITQADLGRSEQATLNAEDAWFSAVRRYKQSMDEFKILLGLSTDARIILDDTELTQLMDKGISELPLSVDDAVAVALAARLDLYTARDAVDDAERKLVVAANALKPGLDLVITGQVDSEPGDDTFSELDWQRARWSAGFDLELPFDRKTERNAYRSALIAYERTARDLDLAIDETKLDVRDAWRTLEQAQRTYRIRSVGVDLNERRVEEQDLLADLGRATALNTIDAQNDLTEARNALTAALVNHTVARLSLWRDMGILFVKENGQWEEVTDVVQPLMASNEG
jgi:outer membrane protein TolC